MLALVCAETPLKSVLELVVQYYHKPAKSKVAKATKKEGGTSIVQSMYCKTIVPFWCDV